MGAILVSGRNFFAFILTSTSYMSSKIFRKGGGIMAGGLGFEPRLTESESVVLPLDDPPK